MIDFIKYFIRDQISATDSAPQQPPTQTQSVHPTEDVIPGIYIKVGIRANEKVIYISHAAMQACSFLHTELAQNFRVQGVDPEIFKLVIDYLDLESKMDCASGSPFHVDMTVGSSDMMLNFAKIWQLGRELELPDLQNKLVDAFRACYIQLQKKHLRLEPEVEAFAWLRNHVGYHSEAEKFLIDFYAGLYRFDEKFPYDTLKDLPDDIICYIQDRWDMLADLGALDDRILNDDRVFKVSKDGSYVKHRTLQITGPLQTPPMSPSLSASPKTPSAPRKRGRGLSRAATLRVRDEGLMTSFPKPKWQMTAKKEAEESVA